MFPFKIDVLVAGTLNQSNEKWLERFDDRWIMVGEVEELVVVVGKAEEED